MHARIEIRGRDTDLVKEIPEPVCLMGQTRGSGVRYPPILLPLNQFAEGGRARRHCVTFGCEAGNLSWEKVHLHCRYLTMSRFATQVFQSFPITVRHQDAIHGFTCIPKRRPLGMLRCTSKVWLKALQRLHPLTYKSTTFRRSVSTRPQSQVTTSKQVS